ncbi:DASH complex subunit ask1 [Coemansia sp. RSA 552]|nr:DASH complex subunit ask1 [Coemansia sp. RSA 552]
MRSFQLQRPDSRSSQNSSLGGGRFTNALSAAVSAKTEYLRPPQNSHQSSAEEQLEEVEQKITLTLQAIDANFDHCQRTMARDVMPKVDRLAKLSGELLEASQPWLQFFMAVASADDEEEDVGDLRVKEEEMGAAQRAVLEEQAYKGDITARFPQDPDESIDIDAEIATPQLTSRYMTEELRLDSPMRRVDSPMRGVGVTPRAVKRLAEQMSGSVSAKRSAKRGRVGTPQGKTPMSMMRALVHSRKFARPGSVMSGVSAGSSLDTNGLMPTTSPPHTTTFTMPQSTRRGRIAPKAVDTQADEFGFGEEDDDDDDILAEVNSLIRRYDSPRVGGALARPQGSVARSVAGSVTSSLASGEEMTQLANKYASPAGEVLGSMPGRAEEREAQRVRCLVADMEEMLDEAEAVQQPDVPEQPEPDTQPEQSEKDEQDERKAGEDEDDLDDELPSPPKITSDLDRSRVVVPEIGETRPQEDRERPQEDRARPQENGGRPQEDRGRPLTSHPPWRGQFRMNVEDMDQGDMTIGHMSPLAIRGRQQQRQQAQQNAAATGGRLPSLFGGESEADPFAATPAVAQRSSFRPAQSAQSDRPSTQAVAVESVRSWSNHRQGGSAMVVGSDATATFDSPGLLQDTTEGTIDQGGVQSIDGTTSILPTREMLQQAAAHAELDEDVTRNSAAPLSPTQQSLVEGFSIEVFPPAFRSPPASLQLSELYELVRSQPERLWSLEDLLAAAPEGSELAAAGSSVFSVLLDLLARRRLVRQVSETLWTGH